MSAIRPNTTQFIQIPSDHTLLNLFTFNLTTRCSNYSHYIRPHTAQFIHIPSDHTLLNLFTFHPTTHWSIYSHTIRPHLLNLFTSHPTTHCSIYSHSIRPHTDQFIHIPSDHTCSIYSHSIRPHTAQFIHIPSDHTLLNLFTFHPTTYCSTYLRYVSFNESQTCRSPKSPLPTTFHITYLCIVLVFQVPSKPIFRITGVK
jgi:hypothetical protein